MEDDPDDVEIYRELFTSMTVPVDYSFARNGEEGLAMLESCASLPELILLDYRLPNIDGLAFVRNVKSHKKTLEIPITVISSVVHPEVDDELAPLGIPCFTKPASISVFRELVNCVIRDIKT